MAAASNFSEAIRAIVKRFEKHSTHKVTLSFGSTGKQYAQIKNGAPFHAFFAADEKRPRLLDEQGVTLPASRFTYATGKLLLWSPSKTLVDANGKVLKAGTFKHLAIANPKLAPYGKAAMEVLQATGLWTNLQGRIVRGENIGQAFQFIKTGNAELGFIARSQVQKPDSPIHGSWWEIPQKLYTPIKQQAVLLKDTPAAREFMQFVKRKETRQLIRRFGYETPS